MVNPREQKEETVTSYSRRLNPNNNNNNIDSNNRTSDNNNQNIPTFNNTNQLVSEMEFLEAQSKSKIVDFYRNRSVLITGGSGFIGKVLIEKLLRTCTNIRNIFVLIRPKWNKQPQERLEELLKVPLFDEIRQRNKDLLKKVIVVEGDVVKSNLGLSDQNLLRIMNEVSVIYHSAATVKFDEPLKQSIGINMAGTKNMIDVCRKIPQLAALVHISTAYANCDHEQIDEHIYPVDMDPERLIELASWLDQETLQELKLKLLKNKPNTYTYTKSLAEWLLWKIAKDLPVVICRPSIVCASWKEPFAGWVDNANGPTGIILGCGKGLVRSMMAETKYVADLIPVDTVINMAIILGWFAHVYHIHKQNANYLAESSASESVISTDSLLSVDESASSSSSSLVNINNNKPLIILQQDVKTTTTLENINEDEESLNNNNNNNGSSLLNFNNNSSYSSSYEKENNMENKYHLQIYTNHHDDGYLTSVSSSITHTDTESKTSSNCSLNVVDLNNSPHSSSYSKTQLNELLPNNDSPPPSFVMMSYVEQRRLDEQEHAAFEYKLKQFRHSHQVKLASKQLPEDIADVPVFHCSSGSDKPITWGQLNLFVLHYLIIYPSISVYRYPSGAFTNNRLLDNFYRFFLHTLPSYLVDKVVQSSGGRPILVKIFNKFNQAAKVLEAFTMNQWKFNTDNNQFLFNELMSDEDKLLFNCDLSNLKWSTFIENYVIGVRQFMLKEPNSNLKQARSNMKKTYYRNLSLQVMFILLIMYCIMHITVPNFLINQLYSLI